MNTDTMKFTRPDNDATPVRTGTEPDVAAVRRQARDLGASSALAVAYYHAGAAVQAFDQHMTLIHDLEPDVEMDVWARELSFASGCMRPIALVDAGTGRRWEQLLRVILAGEYAFQLSGAEVLPPRMLAWARIVMTQTANSLWPARAEAPSRLHVMMIDAARFVERNRGRIEALAHEMHLCAYMTGKKQSAILRALDANGKPRKPARSLRSKASS